MSLIERLLEDGFVPVDLKSENIKVGNDIVSLNGMFGTLEKITKKGNYMVSFDSDYDGEKPTKFDSEKFERFFLVDKR
jgi:hypothetical protein